SIGALISSLMSLRNFFSENKVVDEECDDKTAEDSLENIKDDNELKKLSVKADNTDFNYDAKELNNRNSLFFEWTVIIFIGFSCFCLWGIIATFFCFEYIIPLIENKNKNVNEEFQLTLELNDIVNKVIEEKVMKSKDKESEPTIGLNKI
ncbi:1370_t:CDS:2, partial [Racocetra fulgida]